LKRRDVLSMLRGLAMGCVLLLMVRVCVGQDLRYLSQQVWSTEDGLPQSSVHSVAQTADGYLWVGTEGGLVRFDGVSFKVYGRDTDPAFLSEDICCLLAGAGGDLWVGTADGLVRMEAGRFQRYGVAKGLASAIVLGVKERAGVLTVETTGGFARWDGAGFKAVASDGAASIAGVDGSLWSYDRAGVSVVRGAAKRVWRVGVELPAGRVQTVYVDRAGLAWVGMNDGLWVLDAGAAKAVPVGALGANSVLAVFEDVEGNHWVGTETSGLHVLRRLRFRSEAGLADLAVTSVAQTADGAMWVGTRDDGLRRVRAGVVDEPVAAGALASPVILCLAPAVRGGLWVGTPDGLNFVDERGVVRRVGLGGGLPDETIRSLAADQDGSVWEGTQHGLVHVSGAQVRTLTSAEGLGGDMVGSLLQVGSGAGEVLWVGTSGGVSRVGGDGVVRNFMTKDGLGGEIATAMAVDGEGRFWVATKGGGLSVFDGRRFVTVALDAGVDGMRVDAAGVMWLRRERGVGRVSVAALLACMKDGHCGAGVVAWYGLAEGLPNDEVVAGGSPAEWLAADGEMWFATRGGVAIADTKGWGAKAVAPPVVVERFLVDDVLEPLDAGRLEIPFGRDRFTMEYAGLSFTAPSEVRYRFRLEGFDKDWVDAGGRRSAFYTNLGPGGYRFVVQASGEDGVWSAAGVELRFRVVPPFYRRWWFVLLMVLAVTALLAGLYLLRLRLLRREFDAVLAERNRMAREIHDTLTQDFVGTSLQLDIVSQQLAKGKVELAIEQVKRTRQLVTEGLHEARQSIWELRANSSQDSLPTRLTRLVQREAYAAVGPKLRVGGAYRALDPRVEREVLRIAQEALSNVVHHAGATEATVELQYASDTLLLAVGDNGAGFVVSEASDKAGHYGLLGMKERAAAIDGTLEIESEAGQGTRVMLRVPAKQSGG
jgi:signal transduction histidine kinase/ligand-binding sensor domain-containing protein